MKLPFQILTDAQVSKIKLEAIKNSLRPMVTRAIMDIDDTTDIAEARNLMERDIDITMMVCLGAEKDLEYLAKALAGYARQLIGRVPPSVEVRYLKEHVHDFLIARINGATP